MSTKQEHLDLIATRGKYFLDCNLGSFSTEEIEILEKYGHWFWALTSGVLEPISDLQQRFVLVATGKEDPFSLYEVAWWKFLDQRAYEERRRIRVTIQYKPQVDTFHNRDMLKQQKSLMFKVTRDNHKKT